MKIRHVRLASQLLCATAVVLVFAGWLRQPALIAVVNSTDLFAGLARLRWLDCKTLLVPTFCALALTFLLGRIFCSFCCPVGFLQDLSGKLIPRRNPGTRWPEKLRLARYFVFLTALGLLAFRLPYYQYIEHYSNFGKIVQLRGYGIGFLLFLLLSPLFLKRLFCNLLCPSGMIYSWLQRASALRLRKDNHDNKPPCGKCSLCQRQCPASCIDSSGSIQQDRCIQCFECLQVCPRERISLGIPLFGGPGHPAPSREFSSKRRDFLATSFVSCAGFAVGSTFGSFGRKILLPPRSTPVLPPGAEGYFPFYLRCVSCDLCIAQCPSHVLGRRNGYPALDFTQAFCSYECRACLEVCPVGALTNYPLDRKKRIQVGTSQLDKNLCIPYAKHQDCGACAEHCPTGAITTTRVKGVLTPALDQSLCIGCGACEYICPVQPRKAATIIPLAVHLTAKAPATSLAPSEKKPSPADSPSTTSEFPF